jgi:hypothetical protein
MLLHTHHIFSSAGSTFVGPGDGLVHDNGFVVLSSTAGGISQNLPIKNDGHTLISGALNVLGNTTSNNATTCQLHW